MVGKGMFHSARAGQAVATVSGPRRWLRLPAAGQLAATSAILIFSALVGLTLPVGGPLVAALVIGTLGLFACLAVPIRWLLFALMLAAYVLVGQAQYFARFDKAFWLVFLLGLILYLRLMTYRVAVPAQRGEKQFGTLPLLCFAVFLLCALVSSALARIGFFQWFVAGKEYLFLWSVLLAVLMGAFPTTDLERLMRAVPWFLLAQLPVLAYQRFVVAARRIGDSPFDAVVGLFGGNPLGGGASGAMAIFSLVVLGFTLYGFKAGRLGRLQVAGMAALAVVPILLAEVKFALLLLPLVAVLVFGADLLKRPAHALLGLLLVAVLTAGLLASYRLQFASDRTQEGRSLDDYVGTIFKRSTDADQINFQTGEMGRVAAIKYWIISQSRGNPGAALIGHGMGSTRVGGLVTGEEARKHRFRLGRSSLVIFLWEIGLIGTLAMVSGLAAVSMAAYKLAGKADLAAQAPWLRGAGLGLLLVLLGLPYNTDLIEVAQIQILVMILSGYVIATGRTLMRRGPAPAQTAGGTL